MYMERERKRVLVTVLFLFIRTWWPLSFLSNCCWGNLILFPVAVWRKGFHAPCLLLATWSLGRY